MPLLSRARIARLTRVIAWQGERSTCSDDIRTIYASAASMLCERWYVRSAHATRSRWMPGSSSRIICTAFGPCRRSMMTSAFDDASLSWRSRVPAAGGAVLLRSDRVEFKGPGRKCMSPSQSPCPAGESTLKYRIGIKITNAELSVPNPKPAKCRGKWNYTRNERKLINLLSREP